MSGKVVVIAAAFVAFVAAITPFLRSLSASIESNYHLPKNPKVTVGSVGVVAEADSTVEQGTKVVRSTSLEEFGDYDSFLNSLLDAVKFDLCVEQLHPALKTYEVNYTTSRNTDEFTVKVVLDGAKVAARGVGSGSDYVLMNQHYKLDRANRVAVAVDYLDPKEPTKKTSANVCHFLKDPFRLELYAITYATPDKDGKWNYLPNPDGIRSAGEDLAFLGKFTLESFVGFLHKSNTVRVLADQQGSDGELCFKTNPDTKLPNYDDLIAASMPACAQYGSQWTASPIEQSDRRVKWIGLWWPLWIESQWVNIHELDKDKGIIVSRETFGVKAFRTLHIKINKDPVTIEGYAIVANGPRESGGSGLLREMTLWFNDIVRLARA